MIFQILGTHAACYEGPVYRTNRAAHDQVDPDTQFDQRLVEAHPNCAAASPSAKN